MVYFIHDTDRNMLRIKYIINKISFVGHLYIFGSTMNLQF